MDEKIEEATRQARALLDKAAIEPDRALHAHYMRAARLVIERAERAVNNR